MATLVRRRLPFLFSMKNPLCTWLIFLAVMSLPWSALAAEPSKAELKPFEGQTILAITHSGDKVTRDYVVERELHSRVGEPFEFATILRDYQNLNNVGIFSQIVVTVADTTGGVTLNYDLTEFPWIVPYIKLKYSEENGWSVGPTVTSVNLFGRAIYLSAFLLVGGQTTFSARFAYPWITGNHVSFNMNFDHIIRDNVFYDFEETDDIISPYIGSYIGRFGRIDGTFGYWGVSSDKDNITLSPDNRDNMIQLGGSIWYDSRDSYQDPHRGWFTRLNLIKTGGFIGGDGDFLTANIDLRRYQPIVNRRNTLAAGIFTSLQTGQVGVDIPIYLQYNLGGSNTIRGYSVDGLAQVLQGKNQMLITAEYRYLLMKIKQYVIIKWPVSFGMQLAGFMDIGSAWTGSDEFTTDRFFTGFGFGVRALVPAINVVRFDIGFTLHGEVQFAFGLWSKFDAQVERIR